MGEELGKKKGEGSSLLSNIWEGATFKKGGKRKKRGRQKKRVNHECHTTKKHVQS